MIRTVSYGLMVGAIVVTGSLTGCGQGKSRRTTEQAGPRAVELSPAACRPMARVVTATGSFLAQEASTLSAKVPGRLQSLSVDLGSVVRQGEILAIVELRDYELGLQQARAALAQARTALGLPAEGDDDRIELEQVSGVKQAKAVLEEARKNLERVKSLSASGISAVAELDTMESAYVVARTRHEGAFEDARGKLGAVAQRRAEYELARKKLADATIVAPYDGAVQSRLAGVGEYLPAGSPVLKLVKTDPLRLRLQVPERDSAVIRTGQVVRVFVEGDPVTYTGQLSRLSPALDEQNRMLHIEADIPAQGALRPGLFARADVVVNAEEAGLSVPLGAITTFAGLEKVVVVREGKALEKNVATGRRGPDWAEILSGLEPGEKVVLNPTGLRTGQPVTVTRAAEAQAGAQAAKNPAP